MRTSDAYRKALRFVLAVVTVAGVMTWNPADAEATTTDERIVFGRACDSGPELTLWLADPDSRQVSERSDLGELIGARLSPAESQSGLGADIAAATNLSGLILADLTRPGAQVADLAVGPPPVPFGSFANLAWSPEGNRIAYLADDGPNRAMWIHDLDADAPDTKLVDIGEQDLVTGTDWSPDGSAIVWSVRSNAANQGEVFKVDVGSKTIESLGAGDSPRYSPNGSQIAFVLNGRVATMSPEGTAVVLTNHPGMTPIWSPDGDQIGFVELAGSSQHISILDVGKDVVRRIYSSTAACDDVLSLWDWSSTQVPTFSDVPFGHLFFSDIEWLADEGITKGCGSGRFCPDDPVTRGQMAALLVRAMDYKDVGAGDLFVDDDQSIFEADIDKLGTAGVTRGCNPPVNDRFCPEGLVTRGQMAAFLVRALGLTNDGGGDLFVDDDNSIFEADIDKLRTAGITKGCNPPTNDRFCPDDVVTRGQIAAFLRRALG